MRLWRSDNDMIENNVVWKKYDIKKTTLTKVYLTGLDTFKE